MFVESKWRENHHLMFHGSCQLRKTESSQTFQNGLGKAEEKNVKWCSQVSTDFVKTSKYLYKNDFWQLVTNGLKCDGLGLLSSEYRWVVLRRSVLRG